MLKDSDLCHSRIAFAIFLSKRSKYLSDSFCVPVCFHLEYFGSHCILTVVTNKKNKNSLSIAYMLTILTFFFLTSLLFSFFNRSEETIIYFDSGINYSRS